MLLLWPIVKTTFKYLLQRLLGLERYLYVFSIFKINTLRYDKKENQFFFFMDQLPESGTVLDVGANIGIMSVPLAKRFPQVQVVAIEPIDFNVKTFKKIVEHYHLSNITLIEKAVGDNNGTIRMTVPLENNVVMQGLSHVSKNPNSNEQGVHFNLPIIKIDDIDQVKTATRVTGIKMDVENYEHEALKGSIETIKKHRPLIYIELWDNQNRSNCFELIRNLNYSVMVLQQGQLKEYANEPAVQNFFFVPRA